MTVHFPSAHETSTTKASTELKDGRKTWLGTEPCRSLNTTSAASDPSSDHAWPSVSASSEGVLTLALVHPATTTNNATMSPVLGHMSLHVALDFRFARRLALIRLRLVPSSADHGPFDAVRDAPS
jgi:hypothetical protein